jgi:hypothetical protein
MLGTNAQFQAVIRSVDWKIAGLEQSGLELSVISGTVGASGAVLEELWERRQALRLLVLNREAEAAKPVVDFRKWRDGNGAIYRCSAPPTARRKRIS